MVISFSSRRLAYTPFFSALNRLDEAAYAPF